jgi:hypothetical protein
MLTAQAPAQSVTLPQTYAFTATSNMMGPMTITVNRNGTKELIELAGSGGGYHLRVLYDFQANRIFTVDLNSKQCTTQQYVSPYAPSLHDPIGAAGETGSQAGALRAISRESVNGISARVVEAQLAEGQGKYRIWLEEKFGFPVKQTVFLGSGPERLVFEMRKLSYAPPAAAMFAEPAGCTRIAGTTNANGGSAEMSVGATVQSEAALGGAQPANRAPKGGGNVLAGKWEFKGKDGAGVQWSGELAITKLQPNSFDPASYTNECDISVSSANSGKGMSGPCLYDLQTRRLSFSGGDGSSKFSFTAVLTPDGKSLAQGRWVEGASSDGSWSAVSKTAPQAER